MKEKDYYDQLLESDFAKGIVAAFTKKDKIAVAGDLILYLKCLKCQYKLPVELRYNKEYNKYDQISEANCPKCKR